MKKQAGIGSMADTEPNKTPEKMSVPVVNKGDGSSLDWTSLLTGGGAAMLGHSIASSMFDDDDVSKKNNSLWYKVLKKLIPIGVGAAGAYGGYRLGKMIKSSQVTEMPKTNSVPLHMVEVFNDENTDERKNMADFAHALDNEDSNLWRHLGAAGAGVSGARSWWNGIKDYRDWHNWLMSLANNPSGPKFTPVSERGADLLGKFNRDMKYYKDVSSGKIRSTGVVKKPSPNAPSSLKWAGRAKSGAGLAGILTALGLESAAYNAYKKVGDIKDFFIRYGKYKRPNTAVETNVYDEFKSKTPEDQKKIRELAKQYLDSKKSGK